MNEITVDLSKPVIWTSLGNINEDQCVFRYEWQFTETSCVFIKHVYFQGQEVKREPHVYVLQGSSSEAQSETAQ